MQRFRVTSSLVLLLLALVFARVSNAQNNGQGDPHFKVLHNFQGGSDPLFVDSLAVDGSGNIFGSSLEGGSLGINGARFVLDHNGEYTLLPSPVGGGNPLVGNPGPLLLDSQENLIFTAEAGGIAAASLSGDGGVFSQNARTGVIDTLFSFSGSPIDGSQPFFNVVRDSSGNLYGITGFGNSDPMGLCAFDVGLGGVGCGTVFKLDAKTRQETIIHNFDFDNGWQPFSLVIDKAGNLYGATIEGGQPNGNGVGGCPAGDGVDLQVGGCGLIFKVDTSGNFSILHVFDHTAHCPFLPSLCPPPAPGPPPELQGTHPTYLAVDDDGSIFGVTISGGNFGLGVVFKIDSSGNYSVLHHFAGPQDGFSTNAVAIHNGKFYGTNAAGGDTLNCGFGAGCGVIFSVDTRTGAFSVVHTFSNAADGIGPDELAFDTKGNLIGSSDLGGLGLFNRNVCTGGAGCGNVFRLLLEGDSNGQ